MQVSLEYAKQQNQTDCEKHLEKQWQRIWMTGEGEERWPGETVVPCYSTFVLTIAPSDGGN